MLPFFRLCANSANFPLCCIKATRTYQVLKKHVYIVGGGHIFSMIFAIIFAVFYQVNSLFDLPRKSNTRLLICCVVKTLQYKYVNLIPSEWINSPNTKTYDSIFLLSIDNHLANDLSNPTPRMSTMIKFD